MKIGIFYKNVLSALKNGEIESVESGIAKLSEAGISYYEVDAADIDTEQKEKTLSDALKKNGASVGSLYFKKEIHSTNPDAIAELLQYTRNKIEQCRRIGCLQLMPVVSDSESAPCADEALHEYYDTVSHLSDTYGIHTVFENNSNPNTKSMRMEEIGKLLENSRKLGYLLDTGNFFFSRENALSAIDQYSSEIAGIHLKDVLPVQNAMNDDGKQKVHYTTLGKGVSPIKKTMEQLKQIGYEKGFTIELEPCDTMMQRISDSVQFVKHCQSEILFALTAMEYHERLFNYAGAYESLCDEMEMKTLHMNAVANIMNIMAEKLELDERMQTLAVIIGLFHDIGRYEQMKQYHTFRDGLSIDHAQLSEEILKKGDFLKGLTQKEQAMVLAAIRNHNRYRIEEGLDEETMILAKMIRDADKADIFRVVCSEPFEVSYGVTQEELENAAVSDAVYESIMQHRMVNNADRKTALDLIVGCLAFVYDLNFDVSKQIILKNRKFFCKLDTLTYKNPQTQQRIGNIFREVEQYLSMQK